MAKLIRKISIGRDYKNDAMHYSVGQEVYGGHIICDIVESQDKFSVFIEKNNDVIPVSYSQLRPPQPEADRGWRRLLE